MEQAESFRAWLEEYAKGLFPQCDGIPDHLKAAHSTGSPDYLPLFGSVREAWSRVDPCWDSTLWRDPPEEISDSSTVEDQAVDYDAAFTRSANDYAAAQNRETKQGPRGGRYYVDKTKDGRTYRRHF